MWRDQRELAGMWSTDPSSTHTNFWRKKKKKTLPAGIGRMLPCLMTQSILVHQDPKYEQAPNFNCFKGHLLANTRKLAGGRGFRVGWLSNSIMPFRALFLSVFPLFHP